MPGCRSICRAPAGSSSIRPTASSAPAISIRVAVARDPRQAIPLHGTYLGSADAFVGMEVNINVVSVGESRTKRKAEKV